VSQGLQKDLEEQREALATQHEQQKDLYATIKGEVLMWHNHCSKMETMGGQAVILSLLCGGTAAHAHAHSTALVVTQDSPAVLPVQTTERHKPPVTPPAASSVPIIMTDAPPSRPPSPVPSTTPCPALGCPASGLEKDIASLKREIRERDDTIGDKERRIYELKKKNQELEKFKFVLDYKIKELKKQVGVWFGYIDLGGVQNP
jgi:hypothetical protein